MIIIWGIRGFVSQKYSQILVPYLYKKECDPYVLYLSGDTCPLLCTVVREGDEGKWWLTHTLSETSGGCVLRLRSKGLNVQSLEVLVKSWNCIQKIYQLETLYRTKEKKIHNHGWHWQSIF